MRAPIALPTVLIQGSILACVLGATAFAFAAGDDDISETRKRASQLFNNITGQRASIDDTRVIEMEKQLLSGKTEREVGKVATADPAFIDIRMMNFARRLWSTTESYEITNNDFIATTVGVARDNTDVRELLTGNYYYEYDISNLSEKDRSRFGTVIREGQPNNTHYESAIKRGYSPTRKLIKTSPHIVFLNGSNPNPDPGGLMTSHSFLVNYAQAGTNRRLVEYAFRSFMCVDMSEWMDATRPDDFVGRDVDRFAGGGTGRYQTTCKGCHAQLDAFRPAFAYYHVSSRTPGHGTKVNKSLANNRQIFERGYEVLDAKWKNYATGAINSERFGWRGNFGEGEGLQSFGRMIANSRGYSRCMVRRMFYEICKREAEAFEENAIRNMADQFEKSYRFRDLAEIVASNNICLKRGDK